MMPSSYLWYSPQDVPLSTFETDVSCDPTYPYSYTSDLPFIPDIVSPIISSSSFPYGPTGSSTRQYKSDSIESGSTSLAGDMEPHSPAGRRGQKSEAQTTRGGRQRKVFAVDEEPMRGMSHDSMDSNVESGTVERTPAQKMRRLVQNRVSQRNFRKRQQNQRERLEQQVKNLSSELQEMRKLYGDLMGKYELARGSSEGNSVNGDGEAWLGQESELYGSPLF